MNPNHHHHHHDLASLLSSLISQLLILLLLVFPNPLTNSLSPSPNFHHPFSSLLHHFLSTSNTAAAAILSISRKRKRIGYEPVSESDPVNVIPRDPDVFVQFFNMKVSTFEWLCGLLEPLLECRDPVESPLSLAPSSRLGIGLFKLATGSGYPDVATRFNVSEPDARFCVKQLCRVLCTNFRFWVGFPGGAEAESVSTRFEGITGLPNCCGVLTCCRLMDSSIAAQVVVDSDSRILSIAAGFSGSKSDMEVLNSSSLRKDVEKGLILNSHENVVNVNDVLVPQYFIGDGDYVMDSWLMLPYDNAEIGSVEECFNNVHCLVRGFSSKAVGSLRKWGVLSRRFEGERRIAVGCFGACAILHNMLIGRDDFSLFCDDLDDRGDRADGGEEVGERAMVIRDALATRAKVNV